jgi:hypothetical protein
MSSTTIKDELALRGEEPSVATVSVEEEGRAKRLVTDALPKLLERERARRDASLAAAARTLRVLEQNGRPVSDDLRSHEWKSYQNALKWAGLQEDRIRLLETVAEESRSKASVTVKAEPRTYSPDSPNSWYLDVAAASLPRHPQHQAAQERLARYSRELAVEVQLGSAEGRHAQRSLATARRGETRDQLLRETRALSTGSSSGGSFTTPAYLVEEWAKYRSYGPAFLEQCTRATDPGYGMTLYVPAFSSGGASVTQQTEGSAVANVTPSGSYLSAPLVTLSGEVDVSQQWFDQAGPAPAGVDVVIHEQLMDQMETAADTYVLQQAISGAAASVAGASVWSASVFWQDVAHAASNLRTSAGTVLPPTHVFTPATFGQWALSQCDGSTNGRPLATPRPLVDMPMVVAPDQDSIPPGWTGFALQTSAWLFDQNLPTMPTNSSNATILVANAPSIVVLWSEPTLAVYPETYANDLEVLVNLRSYIGAVVRHSAVVPIYGSAYLQSPTFA